MAEGGFEMDDAAFGAAADEADDADSLDAAFAAADAADAAFDDALGDPADGAEEETEFMDDLENTHEALSTTPHWAGGEEMPDG